VPLPVFVATNEASPQIDEHVDSRRLSAAVQLIPGTHRYQVMEFGLRASLFFTRVLARILRPGLSQATPNAPLPDSALQRCFQQLEAEIHRRIEHAKLAA
jgi:hypothetical protein